MSQINNLRLPPLWARADAVEEDETDAQRVDVPLIDVEVFTTAAGLPPPDDEKPVVENEGASSDTPAGERGSLSPTPEGGARNSFLEKLGDIVFPPSIDEPGEDETSSAVSTHGDDFTLHQAASEGENNVIKKRIQEMRNEGGDELVFQEVNRKNKKGYTPLHLAAMYNRKGSIIHLLEHGAKIDEVGSDVKITPLHLATMYKMIQAARHLIKSGADINIKNNYGSTALHFSARNGSDALVEELLNKNANPNETDHGLSTPLHAAMLSGSTKVTELLLKKGADPCAVDSEGEMPIHYASAEEGHHELIRLLADAVVGRLPEEQREEKLKTFINSATLESDTALHVASQSGYLDTVKTLVELCADVNARTDENQSPLHLAARGGHSDVATFLIESGAKVTASDREQAHPIHKACQFGHLDVVKVLLENKASINHQDRDNYTALMYAVWKGQGEIVSYLLENKAKLNLKDKDSKCVLHIAVEEEQEDMLALLLKIEGVEKLVQAQDKDFCTPLHYAAKKGNSDVLEMILNCKSADVDSCDNEEKTPLHIAAEAGNVSCVKLIGEASPGIVNATDDRGRTALHHAAMNGHRETTSCLIEMGSEISFRDEVKWTPLDYAAKNGFHKTIIILLENEANIDATDKNKMTPLHHASQGGHVECIKTLLEYDADIMLLNIEGKNCLELAIENFKEEACMAILEDERWLEMLRYNDAKNSVPVMDKLIKTLPQVAEKALDKCIEYSAHPTKHRDYTIRYIFTALDPHPDEVENFNYFGPASMVRYKQYNLLSHPLTACLIRDKWARLGHWLYVPTLILYMIYVALLTSLTVIDRQNKQKMGSEQKIIPWIIILLAFIQLIKECLQLYILRKRYFKEMENYVEILMYILSIAFCVPIIIQGLDSRGLDNPTNISPRLKSVYESLENVKWQTGALSILLAWTNFLLYLKRIPTFGVNIVMFTEVFKTLLRVLISFLFPLFAFSFSFYILLDHNNAFKYPGRAIVKTAVMSIGEFEFGDVFVAPYNNLKQMPHQTVTFVIFFLFLIAMPIMCMNLLVGLAVGDIEAVRKQALIVILKNQVHALKSLTNTYPNWILRKRYHSELLIRPNRFTMFSRIKNWFQNKEDMSFKEKMDENNNRTSLLQELKDNQIELAKQKKHLRAIHETLEEHHDLYQKIFEHYKNERGS